MAQKSQQLGTSKMENNADQTVQEQQKICFPLETKKDTLAMTEEVDNENEDKANAKDFKTKTSYSKRNRNAKTKSSIKSKVCLASKVIQNDVLKCQYCEKVYENSIAWRSHQRSHETMNNVNKSKSDIDSNIEYEHKCNHCDRTFKNKGALKLHEKTHEKEKEVAVVRIKKRKIKDKKSSDFKCKYCQMLFKNGGAKSTHELSHERSGRNSKIRLKVDGKSNTAAVDKNVKKVEKVNTNKTAVIGIKCGHCGLTFKNAGACKTHEISHYFDLVSGKPKQKEKVTSNKCPTGTSRLKRRRKNNMVKEKDLKVDNNNIPEKGGSQVYSDYLCKFCDKNFSSRRKLVVHEKGHTESNIGISVCLLCNQSFLQKTGLVLHMSTKHLNEFTSQENSSLFQSYDYQCSVCNERFIDEMTLDQHVTELHVSVKLDESKKCSNQIDKSNLLVDFNCVISNGPVTNGSSKKIAEDKSFYCVICKQQYSSKMRLISHNLRSHTVCHKSIQSSGNFKTASISLQSGVVRHKNKTCCICKKMFNNFSTFFLHMINHRSKKHLYPQNKTQLVTSKHNSLEQKFKQHLEMRKNVLTVKEDFEIRKRYQCNICRKRFLRPYLLKQHLERNHFLDISDIENNFDAKKYLVESFPPRQYLGNNDPRKKYQCDICKNRFRRPYLLKNHLERYHRESHVQSKNDGVKCYKVDDISAAISNRLLYKCPNCGLVFIHHNELTQHVKIHNGQMPYQCKLCFKEFKGRHHLIEHRKTDHPQKRDCPCPICGKMFPNKSHVDTHLIMHTGINPHKCPHCDKRFRRKGVLREHIDKEHTNIGSKK